MIINDQTQIRAHVSSGNWDVVNNDLEVGDGKLVSSENKERCFGCIKAQFD